MNPDDLVENLDRWTPPIAGLEVGLVSLDRALTLVVGDSDDARFLIAIESPCCFASVIQSIEILIAPDGPPEKIGPVLEVLHKCVERVDAFKDGSLEIDFVEGARLRVPVSSDFEAWSVVGPFGLRLVSLPGGELAVWTREA